MRQNAALIVALLLSACAADYPRPVGQGTDTAIARFVPGGEVSVVQVTVSDRRPVRRAELLGPDGVVIPAYSIDANVASAYAQPQYQPPLSGSGAYGSPGAGISLGLGTSAALPGSAAVVSSQIQSTALIRLLDAQDYRRTWADWKVRIQLGDPPDIGFVNLQAPQPPM